MWCSLIHPTKTPTQDLAKCHLSRLKLLARHISLVATKKSIVEGRSLTLRSSSYTTTAGAV